jgi:FTR1 family protein
MFQSLVITLREGVEAALIVGIVLSYLAKTGRRAWNRYAWWGLAAAVASSLAGAYLLHRFEISEDAYEGWLMLVGAVFVASMVYWMWRTGKHLRREIESRLAQFSHSPSRAAAWGVFLFVFLMVFREGAETVLFLAAVSLRTSDLANFLGGMLGLALAVGLGVAFFKGSVKVDLRKFFTVTTLVLFVVAAQLFVSGVHELSEAQVLPSGPREMAIIGPIVNNDAFFFVVIAALVAFLFVRLRLEAEGAASNPSNLSAPERRKLLANRQRERFWKLAGTAASLLVIVLISAQFIYSRTARAMSAPERVPIANGEAQIPTSILADHDLHLMVINVGGTDVRLIAILDASGTVRVGLDACAICGHQGYYQDGNNVICRNCGAVIYVPTIGMAGGCNPIHIDYRVEGDYLRIGSAALAGAAKVFR